MSEKVLLPCPFCGREAKHYSVRCWNPEEEEWIPNFWHRVICNNCGTQTKSFYTEVEAVEAWNRREELERKRGEWKPFDLTWGRSVYSCTACGEAIDIPTEMSKPIYSFCPNCGADMRGE